MKPPIQFRPDPKKKHAAVGSRRVVASGQNPKGDSFKKTGDEVSAAKSSVHGQSSEPQQLLEAYKELERAKVRERVKRHRAKKKTK